MGKLSRRSRNYHCQYPILSPNLYHVEAQDGWQPQYPNDVPTNTGELRFRGKSGSKTRMDGMEYLGPVPLDRRFARKLAMHEHLARK